MIVNDSARMGNEPSNFIMGEKKKNRTKFEGRESACEWDLNREEGITHHPGQKEVGGE